ncbi:hypothetical protein LIER_09982 [Lithospermum erythrorhizon]|uniref:Putative plant transposon protein domain-containing protein n=1 Tax=Lithospermum erythrorhizon TaxID=34254 RepID=A0AAV3PML2_LITER
MTEDIDDPESPNFQKVILRNYTIEFSPSIINAYFGRANGGKTGSKLKLYEIAKVLTGGAVYTWLDKGQIPSSRLSVKYVVLPKVGVVNWVPTTYTTSVSETMAMVLYIIGTGASFNLGQFIFDQTVQHAQSHTILKPIAYPIETRSGSGADNDETVYFLRDEIKDLEGVIQTSLARKLYWRQGLGVWLGRMIHQ